MHIWDSFLSIYSEPGTILFVQIKTSVIWVQHATEFTLTVMTSTSKCGAQQNYKIILNCGLWVSIHSAFNSLNWPNRIAMLYRGRETEIHVEGRRERQTTKWQQAFIGRGSCKQKGAEVPTSITYLNSCRPQIGGSLIYIVLPHMPLWIQQNKLEQGAGQVRFI